MNHIYKTVFNAALGTWVAVPEIAKSGGRAVGSTAVAIGSSGKRFACTAIASAVLLLTGQVAMAATGDDGGQTPGANGNICYYDTRSQSVICGDNTATVADTYAGKTAKSVVLGMRAASTGESGVTIGASASSGSTAATAVGTQAKATAESTVAIGHGATASATFDVAVGRQTMMGANSTGNGSNVAIGDRALQQAVSTNNNIAVGTSAGESINGSHNVMFGAYANSTNAMADAGLTGGVNTSNNIAIGSRALANGTGAVSLGNRSHATAAQAVGIGNSARATGAYSIAQGYAATAGGVSSIAIGAAQNSTNSTKATANFSTAIGYASSAAGVSSVAIGNSAETAAESAVAVGWNAQASNIHTVAIGNQAGQNVANKTGNNNGLYIGNGAGKNSGGVSSSGQIAIGQNAGQNVGNNAASWSNTAVGFAAGQNVNGAHNVALGSNAGSGVAADSTISVGNDSTASSNLAVAVGAGSKADKENAVAIGAGSTTATNATVVNDATIGGVTYSGFAGNSTVLAGDQVSVGTSGQERQIKHVAPGEISDTSTDAINGSQLYQVIDQGGFTIQQNGTATDLVKWGDTINFVNGKGTTAVVSTDGNGKVSNVQYDVAVDGTTIKIDGNGRLYADVIDTNTITTVTAGNGVTVTNIGTANTPNYSVSVNTTSLSTTDGKVNTPVNTNAFATAGDVANAVNSSGFTLTAQGANGSVVNPGETVDMRNTDGNIVIGKTTTDNAVTYNLAKDININSVKTGDTTVNNNGLSIAGGPSVTKTGIDAGGKKITNVAAGTAPTDAVNLSQLNAAVNNVAAASKEEVKSGNRTVNVNVTQNPTGANVYDLSVNVGNTLSVNGVTGAIDVKTDGNTITTDPVTGALKANTAALNSTSDGRVSMPASPDALATAGDIANAINNSGFNLTTSASAGTAIGTSVAPVRSGNGVTIDAGRNIAITQTGSTISVATAADVTFDSIASNNLTVNSGGSLNVGANSVVDMGGNKITNIASGTADTDAVNVGQLNALANQLNNLNVGNIGYLQNQINEVDDRARGGIASAMASAGLPQAYMPGKSMIAVGAGHYRGENAIAIGASTISDNGKWVIKGTANVNRDDVGGSIGIGYQW